ncbi:TPA: Lar family restriction alleviation protein, partial [Enterococcus faecalis]|nr:restriction alleviation protein, Lar family [Enterococcus faecalis]EHK9418107.1 Lar family restriction alleviation protein [Enterococcus faecalis]EHR4740566.1 Lar family restriction alleviation protein [Enterococcus faecalis]EJY7265683.1 Lar family restriction alleviation protein [Enterococcus faecalis]EKA0743785.1 Lar family restriction alleviation protein [Enterococcus faecalis]
MSEVYVKPCPFCGSENTCFNAFSILSDAYVLCKQCNASIEISVPWDDMDEKEHDKVCFDKLLTKWNKRVSKMNKPELNENQQVVLDWLKANVEQDNASPMCAVFLLGEWQTRIGSKELRSVDISYCGLNSKQQAQVLRAFADW